MPKQISYSDHVRMSAALLQAKGMARANAELVAEGLGWADARGVDTHGLAWLPRYLQLMDAGTIDAKAEPSVERSGPARIAIEGHGCHGAVAMMKAMQAAVRIADADGVCVATVRNTTHTGAVGRYAAWAAERGCAALIVVAGPPFMAYHGARVPSLSTSPLAIAIPAEGDPILLDMATSVVAFSRLRQAAARKETIPPGWALDAEGRPTSEGEKAATPLPIAGAKGAGLALMIEMLTSVLLASPILQDHLAPGGRRHQQNALALLLKVEAFRPMAQFATDVSALANLIRSLPRAEGFDEIRLPGERAARLARERLAQGIPVPPTLARELGALCAAAKIPCPLEENLP